MPNSLIDQLLNVALPSSVVQTIGGAIPGDPAGESLRSLTSQIEGLRGIYQSQTVQVAENTAAIVQSTKSRGSELSSTVASVARSTGSVLGGGLTLLPLVSGIAKLFGFGSSKEEQPALSSFALPSAINLDSAVSQSGRSPLAGVTYGQDGLPRQAAVVTPSRTNINVNVQAIDSRSFLDHSDEIARAVREAMLNSHSLNDVISEI